MNKNSILITNGEIVSPYSRYRADVLICDGVVKAIGKDLSAGLDNLTVIDGTGKLILPGIIDSHTHMELPMKDTSSSDSFTTGSIAAACGGVTSIIDFTNMACGKNLLSAFFDRKAKAEGKCAIDWALHSCVKGWEECTEKAIDELLKQGVTSFKMFTVYRNRGLMSEDRDIYSALKYISCSGGLITAHCESEGIVEASLAEVLKSGDTSPLALADSRPNHAEGEAVQRLITFAEITGGRLYIVHMSTREALRALIDGRQRGVNVSGETCPQYLLLNREYLDGENGHLFTCVPPLRDPIDNLTLWDGLEDGHISTVATDHCPFMSSQKAEHKNNFMKMPLGLPGVETLLPLLYNFGVREGRISVSQMVQLLCTNPAMIFGMYPKKGIIQPGSDGDIVIFDPAKKVTISAEILHQNTDYSPYEGMTVRGWPLKTILGGKLIVDNGRYIGNPSDGKFIHRTPLGT
jgi:dihydropyrimidinase